MVWGFSRRAGRNARAPAPIRGAPPGQTPIRNAPPGQTPIRNAPQGQTTPLRGTPQGQTPFRNAPPGQTPLRGAPPGQTPFRNAPPGQTPLRNAPPGQTPFRNAPPGQTPFRNAPPSAPLRGAPPSQPQPRGGVRGAYDFAADVGRWTASSTFYFMAFMSVVLVGAALYFAFRRAKDRRQKRANLVMATGLLIVAVVAFLWGWVDRALARRFKPYAAASVFM